MRKRKKFQTFRNFKTHDHPNPNIFTLYHTNEFKISKDVKI